MKHYGLISIVVCLLASCLEDSGGDPSDHVDELAEAPIGERTAHSELRGAEDAPEAAATWCSSSTFMSGGGTSCTTTKTLRKVADYVCSRDYNGYSAYRSYGQNGCKPGYYGVVSYKCCR